MCRDGGDVCILVGIECRDDWGWEGAGVKMGYRIMDELCESRGSENNLLFVMSKTRKVNIVVGVGYWRSGWRVLWGGEQVIGDQGEERREKKEYFASVT